MKSEEFLNQLDHDKIVTEIRRAEEAMCGEIRVFISRRTRHDAVHAAKQRFLKLGMNQTRERNGVLIYVVPKTRKFAVIGDSAVHEKCGDDFWTRVTQEMTGYFKKGEFTEGIVHGIREAGKLLAAHFPRREGDRNQLPDDIMHD